MAKTLTRRDIKDYLIDEAEYDPSDVETMSDYLLFDSILSFNGIIGFTDDIMSWYKACFDESTLDNLES